MNIDVLCTNGSPTGVTPLEIEDKGVGGAELALMRLVDGLAARGHNIKVFNDPREEYRILNLGFYNRNLYNPADESRDVLITFRGPNDLAIGSKYKRHIGFSCDQFTAGDYNKWYDTVDKMVLISEFHKKDHIARYSGFRADKVYITDLGVLEREYNKSLIKKPYQFIFCSVPDRGLANVFNIWPQIKASIPEANLVVTSDYRLWGIADPRNLQYRLQALNLSGITFLGKVNRTELVMHQLASEVHLYPCIYDENFCIAAAETQAAGCYALTTGQGALSTTNFTGKILNSLPEFVASSIAFLQKPESERRKIQYYTQKNAIKRFSWDKILDYWENTILA